MNLEQRIREHYTRELHPMVFELLDVVKESRTEISRLNWNMQSTHTETVEVPSAESLVKEITCLREVLRDVVNRISNSRKGSIGSIDNVHICQIGVDEVTRWRKALENPND